MRFWRQRSLLVLASVFAFAQLAFSQILASSDSIRIPESLGYIIERHPASAASPSPTILHIQEAHTNYEAQKHISEILEHLVQDYGLKLILVEGGSGDVSLAYLRSYGPLENRKQVGEKYLKAGIISAEEYLDIVSDHPLVLWGVEDKALYDRNVETFLSADQLQQTIRPFLVSVREAVDALKPSVVDATSVDLETKAKAFERHELSLGDYVVALDTAAKQHGVSMEGYDDLQGFLTVQQLEQKVQLDKVSQQQQALIGRLQGSASEAALEHLVDQATAMKAKTIKPVVFYTELKKLAVSTLGGLDGYPQLADYMEYVTQSEQVNPTILSGQLDTFAAALRKQLASTPESQEFSRVSTELDLVEKLLDLHLSPTEYQQLNTINLQTALPEWVRILNEQASHHGLATRTFPSVDTVIAQLPQLRNFYEVAKQRDEALVKNALAKLKETGEPLAVLITGGFHSPQITKMLTDQGVGTVVVTPKVSTPTDERLYRAVVKYKSGRGSFDEVMSIASQTTTE